MSSVPIVPLFLPQPLPPFPADSGSIHSAGSTTNANACSDDEDTAIPVPINDALAGVLLGTIAPAEDILVAADATTRDILVPDAVPPDPPDDVPPGDVANAPDDISFDDVADAPDDVSFDDVAAASPDVTHE